MNMTLTYPSEKMATFRCRYEPRATISNWLINGSDYLSFADLTMHFTLMFETINGTIAQILSITVTPELNGTQVACVATVDGAPVMSPNATLTVMIGLLGPVHSNWLNFML